MRLPYVIHAEGFRRVVNCERNVSLDSEDGLKRSRTWSIGNLDAECDDLAIIQSIVDLW